MHYLIMYDIASAKRLTKIAKIMLDYGVRVQYSLFEAEIYPLQLAELNKRINKVIKQDEDSIKIFHFCEKCANKRRALGKIQEKDKNEPFLVI